LSATRIFRACQPDRTSVFDVTGSATHSERHLIRVVCGSVMAPGTGIVANFRTEKPKRSYMANITFPSQHGVSGGERPAAVNLLTVDALRGKPSQCNKGNQNRQPEPPTPQGMCLPEILQVHPLGQIFCRTYAPRHCLLSVTQRHYCMHRSQQQ